jgi:hypothetical protein
MLTPAAAKRVLIVCSSWKSWCMQLDWVQPDTCHGPQYTMCLRYVCVRPLLGRLQLIEQHTR